MTSPLSHRAWPLARLIGLCLIGASAASCVSQGQVDALLGPTSSGSSVPTTVPSIVPVNVGTPALTFSPVSNDYGNVIAFSGSSSKTITVQNASTRDVYLTTITGANTHYTITSTTCDLTGNALPSLGTCTITVTFAPQASGQLIMALTINYSLTPGGTDVSASTGLIGTGVSSVVFGGLASITSVTTTTAQLNWLHVAGAVSYQVFNVDTTTGVATLVSTVAAPTQTYTVTGLIPNTTYKYRVRLIDTAGVSDTNIVDRTATTAQIGSFSAIAGISVAEGATQSTAALSCSDSLGSTPSYSIVSQTDSSGNCSVSGGAISCSPSYKAGHLGWSSTVNVRCDLNGSSFTQSFVLTVSDTNRAPVLDPISNQTVTASSPIATVAIRQSNGTTDADGDVLGFSAGCVFSGGGFGASTPCSSLPGTKTFDTTAGTLDWTPSAGAAVGGVATVYSFTVSASDQQPTPLTASRTFTVTVNPNPNLLTMSPNGLTFSNQIAGTGTVTQAVTITNTTASSLYITSIGTSTSHFTIANVNCPTGAVALTASGICTINVTFAPVGVGQFSTSLLIRYDTVPSGTTYTLSAGFNGRGTSPVTFSGIDTVDNVTTTKARVRWTTAAGANSYRIYKTLVSTGASLLEYTASAGATSYTVSNLAPSTQYRFSVQAVDAYGAEDGNTNSTLITTAAVGTFAAIASPLNVAEGVTGSTAALSCTDSLSSTPSYSITSQSDTASSCTISGNQVSCSPVYKTGHSGWTSTVTVQCDLNDSALTRTFTVSVSDTNRAPVLDAIADQIVTVGNAITAVNAGVGSTDFDADLDALTYTCTYSGGPSGSGSCSALSGTASFNTSTGVLNWTPDSGAPNGNANTNYAITITASDGQASPLTGSQTFNILVKPVPPSLASTPAYSDSTFLNSGTQLGPLSTLTYDFNNIRDGSPGNDTSMTYICDYDRTVDGNVTASGAAPGTCGTLPGTFSFNTSTGVFSWTPGPGAYGPYEFKITGVHATAGSSSVIFVVNVRPGYSTTNLLADYDAGFANLKSLPTSAGYPLWKDLMAFVDGSVSAFSSGGGYTGLATAASPHRLAFDGTGYASFSSVLSGQSQFLINGWVNPTSPTTANKVLLTNGGGTGNGVLIRQASNGSGKVDLVVGQEYTSYSQMILADSPVGYWRMNDTNSTLADSSGNGRNGNYSGSVTQSATGLITDSDTAATFTNSSAQYAFVTAPSFGGTASFSAELWFKKSSGSNYYPNIFGRSSGLQGWSIFMAGNSLYFGRFDGTSTYQINYNYNIIDNVTYHIVATYDGTTMILYVNGVEVNRMTNTASINLPGSNATYYLMKDSGSTYLYGTLDEVALYQTALSPARIKAHYNAGIGKFICRSNSILSTNTWYHLASLFDGTNYSLYINGQSECSASPATSFSGSGTMYLGALNNSIANAWSGAVAALQFYTTATYNTLKQAFDATADRFRAFPVGNVTPISDSPLDTTLVAHFDASNAVNGLSPPTCPGGPSTWFDLSFSSPTNPSTTGFSDCEATAGSGWSGAGTTANPYRLRFKGSTRSSDFVTTGVDITNTLLSNGHTLEAWFRTTTNGNIFVFGGTTHQNYGGSVGYLNVYCGTVFGGNIGYSTAGWASNSILYTFGQTVSDGNWHHLVCIWDRANSYKYIYLDGKLTNSAVATPSGTYLNHGALLLGNNCSNNCGYTNDLDIAVARVYRRPLTNAEVYRNCKAQKSRFGSFTAAAGGGC